MAANTAAANLIGERFDRLLVVSLARTERRGRVWLCRCDCGAMIEKPTGRLRRRAHGAIACRACEPDTRSRAQRVHGGTCGGRSRLHTIWSSMHQRCSNPNVNRFRSYGGRGIRVCSAWSDFAVFRAWALDRGYQPGLTIDRIDNDGNYEPANCRFLTRSENSRRAAQARRAA